MIVKVGPSLGSLVTTDTNTFGTFSQWRGSVVVLPGATVTFGTAVTIGVNAQLTTASSGAAVRGLIQVSTTDGSPPQFRAVVLNVPASDTLIIASNSSADALLVMQGASAVAGTLQLWNLTLQSTTAIRSVCSLFSVRLPCARSCVCSLSVAPCSVCCAVAVRVHYTSLMAFSSLLHPTTE